MEHDGKRHFNYKEVSVATQLYIQTQPSERGKGYVVNHCWAGGQLVRQAAALLVLRTESGQ